MNEEKNHSAIEHIRLRHGMYVAHVEETIFQELLSNAIDEFIAEKVSEVHIEHTGNRIHIRDNGHGMSLAQMEELRCTQKLEKSDKNKYSHPFTLAKPGFGLLIAVALSSEFEAKSYQNDTIITLSATHGKIRPIQQQEKNNSNTRNGFEVTAELDSTLFADKKISADFVQREVKKAVCLYPGLTIFLNGEKMTGTLKDLMGHNPLETVEYSGKLFDFVIEHYETGTTDFIRSFVNGRETLYGGIHTELMYRILAEEFSKMPTGWFSNIQVILHLHVPLNELYNGNLYFSTWSWLRLAWVSENPSPILSEMKDELRAALRDPELRRTLESWR